MTCGTIIRLNWRCVVEQVQNTEYVEISESFAGYVTSLLYLSVAVLLFYLGGQVRVQSYPVPFTLQSLVVLWTAMVYPKRLALMSQNVVYWLVLAGIPLLSHTGVGMAALLTPTAGYLMGFYVATVFLVNTEPYRRGQPLGVWLVWTGLAQFLIWFSGVAWLTMSLGFVEAVSVGLVPFLLPDTAKVIAAVLGARWLLSR